jgi:hypothetical protein
MMRLGAAVEHIRPQRLPFPISRRETGAIGQAFLIPHFC